MLVCNKTQNQQKFSKRKKLHLFPKNPSAKEVQSRNQASIRRPKKRKNESAPTRPKNHIEYNRVMQRGSVRIAHYRLALRPSPSQNREWFSNFRFPAIQFALSKYGHSIYRKHTVCPCYRRVVKLDKYFL